MTSERNSKISDLLHRALEAIWPFGAFQKTKDPHRAIENLERASGAATLWILAGILVEMGALFAFDHHWPERLVGMIANAAIGSGLMVEYLVIGRVIDATKEAERESNERIAKIEERAAHSLYFAEQAQSRAGRARREAAEAQKQAAELGKRAAEAELKLEQLRSEVGPRKIDPKKFLEIMRGQPVSNVEILYVKEDDEARSLASFIAHLLSDAGWNVHGHFAQPILSAGDKYRTAVEVVGGSLSGVTLVTRTIDESQMTAALSGVMNGDPAPVEAVTALNGALLATLGKAGRRADSAIPEGMIRIVVAPRL